MKQRKHNKTIENKNLKHHNQQNQQTNKKPETKTKTKTKTVYILVKNRDM